jgi:hypothetical protein
MIKNTTAKIATLSSMWERSESLIFSIKQKNGDIRNYLKHVQAII